MVELPSFDISGQVAFVTGASSGIGRRFAQLLAAAGAKVALAARREDRLAELGREIEGRGGVSLPVACALFNPDTITASIAGRGVGLGPLVVVVNSGGVVVA